jgi:serine/threonine protein kinase
MEMLFAFMLGDPEHFEPIGRRPIARQFFELARALLPNDWILEKGGMWLMATGPNVQLPQQGFKIHVSATVENAVDVIQAVIPVCASAQTSFKLIADVNLLYLAGCKNFGRGSSSKFITIYPRSQDIFAKLIDTLYECTRHLDGPYILSDARYKDSRVVFYRYGGFQRMEVVNVGGTREPVIRNPAGEYVTDNRLPFYQVPSWVDDPYGNESVTNNVGRHVLKDRYEIEASLAFSNRGGVYRARDLTTGMPVVVKEARRLTATWNGDGNLVDAISILRREHAMLAKLQGLEFVPRLIDLFEEWEHLFLIEELVAGVPLTRYRARHDAGLSPFTGEIEKTRNFCVKFRAIATQLLAIVQRMHELGVVLGDLSPSNVLIDPDSMQLRLIDLEAATNFDVAPNAGRLWAAWATPGFASVKRSQGTGISPNDDLYSLGMILYSLITPVQSIFQFESRAFERILARIVESVQLPSQIPAIINSLIAGGTQEAKDILDGWDIEESIRATPGPKAWLHEELEAEVGDLGIITRQIADHVLSTTDCRRSDRLWPADYMVFQTNPLSVAFGACGTLLFLRDVYGEIPNDIDQWFLKQEISAEKYAPGLYVGIAGIAHTMLELGREERAAELMQLSHRSPLCLSDPTVFHGAAGVGLVDLQFYQADHQQQWLDHACEIGEYLLRSAEERGEGCCWRNSVDGLVHFGFGYGSSGIGLFLLYLGQLTGDKRFATCARHAVAFDVASAVDFGGTRKWVRFEGDSLTEPYWLHGAAGIGGTLIRFADVLGDAEFKYLATQAANAAYTRFAVTPGQIEGLSGIAELMLDMFLLTGEDAYRLRALELTRSIMCFRIERPTGLAFPGRQLIRLSTDFAFGSAGVGAFIHRLQNFAPRRLHDLPGIGVQNGPARV